MVGLAVTLFEAATADTRRRNKRWGKRENEIIGIIFREKARESERLRQRFTRSGEQRASKGRRRRRGRMTIDDEAGRLCLCGFFFVSVLQIVTPQKNTN